MKPIGYRSSAICLAVTLVMMVVGVLIPSRMNAAGTWSTMSIPPVGMGRPQLLSDGALLSMDGSGNCVRLIPDIHGSYTNGSWLLATPMTFSRWNFGGAELTNGNLLVVGGEYGGGSAPGQYWNGTTEVFGTGQTCEIYNPVNNVWAQANPNLLLGDCPTELLPGGNVLVAPANDSGLCALFDANSNGWEYGTIPAAHSGWDECTLVKLPNGCIFAVDDAGDGEHYVPSSKQWVLDGVSPVAGGGGENTSFLLPNGKVLYMGQATNTAFYAPGSSAGSAGTWSNGPNLPSVSGAQLFGGQEGGGITLPNGNLLLQLFTNSSAGNIYSYEFNYQSNTFTSVPNDPAGGGSGYGVILPDGKAFFADGSVYTPAGPQLLSAQPVINSITENPDGSYHLTGLNLTGFTEGQSAIDDGQSAANIPLVRLTNNMTGYVYYARTYNWSSGGVQTGTNIITTEFSLPANLPTGTYSLVAVAVGIASSPVSFTYAPPSTPAGLMGAAGNHQVVLSWNAVSGATAYNVKQQMAGNPPYYATVSTVTGTSSTNVNLANLYSYSFVVSAVGSSGESSNSLPDTVTPLGPAATPVGVSAYANTFARVTLNWTPVPGAINIYNIKRSTTSGGPYTNVGVSINQFYTDSGLNVGQNYYYVVSATNVYGESSNSVEVSAVPENIANSGFEQPPYAQGEYNYDPTNGVWQFSGGSGMLANGSGFGNANAPEGLKAAFVQSNGVVSQVLSGFVPGNNYVLTYSAAQRSGNSQTWNVQIDSTVIQTNNTPGGSGFTDYSATFAASAPVHTLSFVGTDLHGGDNTIFLDDVAIWPVSPGYGGNFGFESPGIGSGNYQYNPSGGTWTFDGSSGNGSGIVANGSGFSNPNAPQGVQAAFVQTYGMISQALTNLTPGTLYNLHYLAAQRPGNSQTWNVTIDNTVIQSNNASGSTSYSPYSATFVATSSSHTLKFVGTDLRGGDNTIFIDDVIVGVALQPLPPPSITLSGVTNGELLNFSSTVNLSANVVANGNNITAVQYVYDSTNVVSGQLTVAPYSFSWSANLTGNHSVFARVYYNNGSYQDSSAAAVTLFAVLPATAVDVVGSQIAFSTAITGVTPLSCQWQKISGGVTNNIAGATNTILTLTNLQLSDTASYELVVSNAYGAVISSPRPLTVNSLPSPMNNVITAYAAQTGLGGSNNNFYTTWMPVPGSLIQGLAPSSVGPGDFTEPVYNQCGTVAVLTDGSIGFFRNIPNDGDSPAEVACGSGAGQSVTYTLTTTTNGYNLTNIVVYGGWGDAGRDQQAYTVYYSQATAPTTFIQLGSANYLPSDPSGVQSATRATFMPASGFLATNVAALKFDFTTPVGENGYEGYSEIQVFGTPSQASLPPLPSPWLTTDIGSVGITGSAGYSSGVFTANGSGNAISNSIDAFRFVYQFITNSFTMTVRVASQSNTSPWALAGVMVRETTNANSVYFAEYLTPASSHGLSGQYRATTGGNTVDFADRSGIAAPYWVRIVRNNNTFTAYRSSDGTSWTKTGNSQNISMASTICAGLAVCSGNNSMLETATFDNVTDPPLAVVNTSVTLTGTIQNDQFTLEFQGVNDLNYIVETSTNLMNWMAVYTNALTTGDNGTFIYLDTNGLPLNFYRITE